MKNNQNMRWISVLRIVLANLVLVNHLRIVIFPSYSELQDRNIALTILYVFSSLGRESVIVFFVISGFLITRRVLPQISDRTFNLPIFFLGRLTRLWIVLIPALLLTGFLNLISCFENGQSRYCSNSLSFVSGSGVPLETQEIKVFVSNILFLQGIIAPMYGANSPLWSLSFEFWCYVTFISLISLILTLIGKNFRLSCLSWLFLVLSLSIMASQAWILYLFYWFVGGSLAFFHSKHRTFEKKYTIPTIFILLIVFMVIDRRLNTGGLISVIGTILFIGSLDFSENLKKSPSLFLKVNFDYSYSLYAIHFPIVGFIDARILFTSFQDSKLEMVEVFLFIFVLILINGCAYAFGQKTEKKTSQVREHVIQILRKLKGL